MNVKNVRIAAAGTATLLVVSCLSSVALAQTLVPRARVTFSIGESYLRSTLQEADLDRVEAEVSEHTRLTLQSRFSFLKWSCDTASNVPTVRAHLRLSLEIDAEKAGKPFYLQFAGQIDTTDVAALKQRQFPVYARFANNVPSNDPDRLSDDLIDSLESTFANQDFCRSLFIDFLNSVPLAESIVVRPDLYPEWIFVPICYDSLRASGNTVLKVRFRARDQANAIQGGTLGVFTSLRADGEVCRTGIMGALYSVEHPRVWIGQPPVSWRPQIDSVLQGIEKGSIRVTMWIYERADNYDEANPIAMTPR
jgi:hypothetical protein